MVVVIFHSTFKYVAASGSHDLSNQALGLSHHTAFGPHQDIVEVLQGVLQRLEVVYIYPYTGEHIQSVLLDQVPVDPVAQVKCWNASSLLVTLNPAAISQNAEGTILSQGIRLEFRKHFALTHEGVPLVNQLFFYDHFGRELLVAETSIDLIEDFETAIDGLTVGFAEAFSPPCSLENEYLVPPDYWRFWGNFDQMMEYMTALKCLSLFVVELLNVEHYSSNPSLNRLLNSSIDTVPLDLLFFYSNPVSVNEDFCAAMVDELNELVTIGFLDPSYHGSEYEACLRKSAQFLAEYPNYLQAGSLGNLVLDLHHLAARISAAKQEYVSIHKLALSTMTFNSPGTLIIEISSGDGALTEQISKANPEAQIICFETSEEGVHSLLDRRLPNVEVLNGDSTQFEPYLFSRSFNWTDITQVVFFECGSPLHDCIAPNWVSNRLLNDLLNWSDRIALFNPLAAQEFIGLGLTAPVFRLSAFTHTFPEVLSTRQDHQNLIHLRRPSLENQPVSI